MLTKISFGEYNAHVGQCDGEKKPKAVARAKPVVKKPVPVQKRLERRAPRQVVPVAVAAAAPPPPGLPVMNEVKEMRTRCWLLDLTKKAGV
jgi:hypothetical protein